MALANGGDSMMRMLPIMAMMGNQNSGGGAPGGPMDPTGGAGPMGGGGSMGAMGPLLLGGAMGA